MSFQPNQPPFIPPNATVTTPSSEWAQETVGAVEHVAEATKGNVPMHEGRVPGAFPGSVSSRDEQEFASTAQQTLASAQQTAKELYTNAGQGASTVLSGAGQSASTVLSSAEQAARQYLPEGVVNKLEQVGIIGSSSQAQPTSSSVEQKIAQYDATHHDTRPGDATSLPSHETGSFHATHGGVGTLPGLPTEAGVAKLPDERTQELRDELPTHESGAFKPSHVGVGSLPGAKDEAGVAVLPDERRQERLGARDFENPKEVSQLREELPTRERDTNPTHGGVGSLPGGRDEVGVAKLPEERKVELDEAKKEDYKEATKAANKGAAAVAAGGGAGLDTTTGTGAMGIGAGAFHHATGPSSTQSNNPYRNVLGTQEPTGPQHQPRDVNVFGSAPADHVPTTSNTQPASNILGTKEPTSATTDASKALPSVPKDREFGMGAPGTHEPTSTPGAPPKAAPAVPKDREYGLGATGPAAVAQGGGHGAPPVHPDRTTKTEGRAAHPAKEEDDEHRSTTSGGSESTGKVGFGTKLKAEAKIISGKMTRDHEKVEEGKAMKNPNA